MCLTYNDVFEYNLLHTLEILNLILGGLCFSERGLIVPIHGELLSQASVLAWRVRDDALLGPRYRARCLTKLAWQFSQVARSFQALVVSRASYRTK
jgi:hypothetical protein